jgi:hypothetical protein
MFKSKIEIKSSESISFLAFLLAIICSIISRSRRNSGEKIKRGTDSDEIEENGKNKARSRSGSRKRRTSTHR